VTLVKLNVSFFSYSQNLLKNAQTSLDVIQGFNPDKRVTKSYSMNSAREEFAQRGFFTALTEIHNSTKSANLVEDKRYNLTYLSEIGYPEVDPGTSMTVINNEYMSKLQTAIAAHFENHQYAPSLPEKAENPPTGGGPPEMVANLIENAQQTISYEFGILCAAISDIALRYYLAEGQQTGGDDTKPPVVEEPPEEDAMPVVEPPEEDAMPVVEPPEDAMPVVEPPEDAMPVVEPPEDAMPVKPPEEDAMSVKPPPPPENPPGDELDNPNTRVENENRNQIKSILTRPITPEYKALAENAIMDFLESCQSAIMSVYEWASINDIGVDDNREFAKVRLNYLYVYALFSAMLTDPDVILSSLSESADAVKGLFENIADQNNPNPQIWPISFVYKGLFGDNSMYSEYCVNSQTGVHFKERSGFNAEDIYLMVQQCIKIRYRGITDLDNVDPFNVIMAVFLFFQNYFKYIILRKIESETDTNADYSQYGYYPGFLEGFNRTDNATVLLNILELLSDNGGIRQDIPIDSMTYESDQYQHIYTNFNHVTFRLLLFIRNEKQYVSSARQLKLIKIGGHRKQKRTMKLHSRKKKPDSNRRSNRRRRYALKTARKRPNRRASNRKQPRSTP